MHDSEEIVYNFETIDDAINVMKVLHNRAMACGNMEFEMQVSDGDSKTVLMQSFNAMAHLAVSVAAMLGGMINQLNDAKAHMSETDRILSGKMTISKP